jgi:hypothetical protein
MSPVTGGIPVEFCQPPFPAIRWCGAIHTSSMPMPKAAMNEDDGFEFRQNDVGTAGKLSDVEAKAIAHSMKQRTNGFFRRRVLAANSAHIPRTPLFGEEVFVHINILRHTGSSEGELFCRPFRA